jgi:spermidine synthase
MPKTKNWQWYLEENSEFETHMHALSNTYFSGRTQFQDVGVVESPVFGKMLILDGDTQSSQADEYIYHDTLVHPAMIMTDRPKKVLMLGAGEGATLREVLRHNTVEKVIMVDIDKEVVDLCRKYLPEWSDGAFENSKAEIHYMDAFKFVNESKEKYDLIISDLTEPLEDSPSYKLFTIEFFRTIKEHLTDGGSYVLQASTTDFHNLDLHTVMFNTLSKVFKVTRSFSSRVPAYDTMWGFIFCSDKNDPLLITKEEVDKRIAERIKGELKYYDGITHLHMFNTPKYLRKAIGKQTRILQEKDLLK